MRLASAQQMRDLDNIAINNYGIPGVVLMENAGRATVEAMEHRWGSLTGQAIAIFVGPGNNGGDGLVIARHLHQRGGLPRVYLLVGPDKFQGDAAVNLRIVEKLPVPLRMLDDDSMADVALDLQDCFLIVDAIFGTGLKREVLGFFGELIRLINQSPRPVISVDIPSGLHADTGKVLGRCVRADCTVTFGTAKPGLILTAGKAMTGDLAIADIGIPPEAWDAEQSGTILLEECEVAGWLPARIPDSHKGSYGHLFILAGSVGKTGAALLAAQGALRAGTGLVTLGVPKNLNQIFEAALPEAMTEPLPGSDEGMLSIQSLSVVHALLKGKKAVAIGPGLGTAQETVDLVATLYRELAQPMVVDADAINILAHHPSILKQAQGPRILTPHPGEMARLLGQSSRVVQADRLGIAARFAQEHAVILVLKGAGTVIAHPDGRIAINSTGNAGMATGGMGDVLTGLIGGFLAQGLDPWPAACLGVYLHGMAGDRLAELIGAQCGFLASELAETVPAVLTDIVDSRFGGVMD